VCVAALCGLQSIMKCVLWVHVSLSNFVEIVHSINYVDDCIVVLLTVLYVLLCHRENGLLPYMHVILIRDSFTISQDGHQTATSPSHSKEP